MYFNIEQSILIMNTHKALVSFAAATLSWGYILTKTFVASEQFGLQTIMFMER
jgi:hypothetical protein